MWVALGGTLCTHTPHCIGARDHLCALASDGDRGPHRDAAWLVHGAAWLCMAAIWCR